MRDFSFYAHYNALPDLLFVTQTKAKSLERRRPAVRRNLMEQLDGSASAVEKPSPGLRPIISPNTASSSSPVRSPVWSGRTTSTPVRRSADYLTVSDVSAETHRLRTGPGSSGGRTNDLGRRSRTSSGRHDDDVDSSCHSDLSVSFDLSGLEAAGESRRRSDLPEAFDERCREQVRELEQRILAARSLGTDAGDRLALEYESQIRTLKDCHLEQLENVQVAIKVGCGLQYDHFTLDNTEAVLESYV
jgi:hypothetical protein